MTTLREVSRPRSAQRPSAKHTETKQQRAQRLKKGRAEKLRLRQRLVDDDDAVLTFKEWCGVTGHSERQGRRIIASGNGPTIIQISDRRIGISRKHHRLWLAQRAR